MVKALLLPLNSIDGELKPLLMSHCPSLPAAMQQAYVMGLFANTETALLDKLKTFQSGYGFTWWRTEYLRLRAVVHQNNTHLPSRTLAGYWGTMTHSHSIWQRKHQQNLINVEAMLATPEPIADQLTVLRQYYDKALTHQRINSTIAPSKGALWSAKLTGSPAAIQNQIQQLSLPEHQHFVACMIVSDAPIQEYDTLCQ